MMVLFSVLTLSPPAAGAPMTKPIISIPLLFILSVYIFIKLIYLISICRVKFYPFSLSSFLSFSLSFGADWLTQVCNRAMFNELVPSFPTRKNAERPEYPEMG